jgi:hypothetical protein
VFLKAAKKASSIGKFDSEKEKQKVKSLFNITQKQWDFIMPKEQQEALQILKNCLPRY